MNTAILAMDRYPISNDEAKMIEYSNLAFY
jgi:hypothetical protein